MKIDVAARNVVKQQHPSPACLDVRDELRCERPEHRLDCRLSGVVVAVRAARKATA